MRRHGEFGHFLFMSYDLDDHQHRLDVCCFSEELSKIEAAKPSNNVDNIYDMDTGAITALSHELPWFRVHDVAFKFVRNGSHEKTCTHY